MWWLLALTASNIHTQTQTVTCSATQKHHSCQHTLTHILQNWFCRNCRRLEIRLCRHEGCIMTTFALSYCINWTYNNIWSSQWIKNHKQSRVIKNVACMTLLYISVYSIIWIDHCVWCLVAILQELFQHLMCGGMNPFIYYHAVILYLLHSCHAVTDRQLWLLISCIVYSNYFIWKQAVGITAGSNKW